MEMEGPGQVLGKTSITMMYKIKLVLYFLFPLKRVNLAFLLLSTLLLLHQPDLEIAKLCLPPSSPSKKTYSQLLSHVDSTLMVTLLSLFFFLCPQHGPSSGVHFLQQLFPNASPTPKSWAIHCSQVVFL